MSLFVQLGVWANSRIPSLWELVRIRARRGFSREQHTPGAVLARTKAITSTSASARQCHQDRQLDPPRCLLHGHRVLAIKPAPALAEVLPLTASDVLSAHEELFQRLFDRPWQSEHWTYELSEPVTGPGRYPGANQFGQTFELTLLQWGEVDLTQLELPEDISRLVAGRRISIAWAVALLSTSASRAHSFGVIASVRDQDGLTHWSFLPTYPTELASPLLELTTISPMQGTLPDDDGFRDDVPAPPVVPANSDCVGQAIADYEAEVRSCNDLHNTKVSICNAVYTASIELCNNAYNSAVDGALSSFEWCMRLSVAGGAVCLLTCLAATGGWGIFFCELGCLTVIAELELTCALTYRSALQSAGAARLSCSRQANVIRAGCLATAHADRNACIDAAALQFADRLALCGGGQ